MSRYSRIFLRPKDSWTAESSSKISTSAGPASTGSPGFSYPPSSLPDSPFPMASPPPHPYTLGAAVHSAIETSSREGTSTTHHAHVQYPTNNTNTSDYHNVSEKPLETLAMGHQYPRNTTQIPLSVSRSPPPLPLHRRPAILLLLFLPVPPLLSLIYMAVGHAILRASKSSSMGSIFQSPLLSSVEAGATGGIILALPIALLLYILVIPSRPTAAPEDFFEDDTSSMLGQAKLLRYFGYVLPAIIFLCVGGLAGPLGVTCLSSGTLDMFVGSRKMLSTGAAASAGFLGGAIIAGGIFMLCISSMAVWTLFVREEDPQTA